MQWQGAVGTADFLMMSPTWTTWSGPTFSSMATATVWHPMRLDGYDQGNPLYTVMPAAKLYEILGPLVLEEAWP